MKIIFRSTRNVARVNWKIESNKYDAATHSNYLCVKCSRRVAIVDFIIFRSEKCLVWLFDVQMFGHPNHIQRPNSEPTHTNTAPPNNRKLTETESKLIRFSPSGYCYGFQFCTHLFRLCSGWMWLKIIMPLFRFENEKCRFSSLLNYFVVEFFPVVVANPLSLSSSRALAGCAYMLWLDD